MYTCLIFYIYNDQIFQLKCWTAGAKWGRQFYYDKEYICAIDSEEAYEFWKKEMKYEED